ncbi:exosortase F system-associated membrane protein [Ulvibacter litoralis]|uniref:Exosortase F-associated protein n=1 Tax=Ulvibacter litoralis TaxID=227084 RepID=A0A1G7CDH5_9FLAO|nr:exosortase F system-associated protein [Ulvibacter litoralis]GHC47784.1 exosortase F system-associated protein [Ulvibacter litoralis]SDE37359.1 exosortase F-associated protein [Ulvibacter litoralis]
MTKVLKIAGIAFLGALLVVIRFFESSLFYDPLIVFFKSAPNDVLPNFETVKLLLHVGFRFVLNTLISLGILWFIFESTEILKLSAIFYLLFFVVLMVALTVLLDTSEAGQHMTLFYVRRFLIQPIFLLILIPAFYFQKKK